MKGCPDYVSASGLANPERTCPRPIPRRPAGQEAVVLEDRQHAQVRGEINAIDVVDDTHDAECAGLHYRDRMQPGDGELVAFSEGPAFAIDRSTDGVRWRTIGRQPNGLDHYAPIAFEETDAGYVIGGTVAEPQGEEDRGEGEVEAVARRVLQHAAEDRAQRGGGDPATVERQ